MAHILIVEDEPINAEVAAVICEGAGHTTRWALNGEEALRLLEAEQFDLLLVDALMPVMDGLTLTRRVREAAGLAGLPIIGLTAKASQADLSEMVSVGMNQVLTKPYRNKELLAVLESYLPSGA